MSFNIALNALKKAKELYPLILFDPVLTPNGPGKSVSVTNSDKLFDFFEQCMVVTTFSYQALEVFCNHTIERELKSPIEIVRKGKVVRLTPSELEGKLSTSEKLATILPKIKSVASPKGTSIWQDFSMLRQTRDSTIHLKSNDQKTVDQSSLFFQFLSLRAFHFPFTAYSVIKHFIPSDQPRWLLKLKKRFT